MTELLFWFLVSQTLAGLPQLPPGTEVRLVSGDLLTVYGSARVEDGSLSFESPLSPGLELRVLIFPPGSEPREQAAALAGMQAMPASVSEQGDDILIRFPELDGPLSFRLWLKEERGITLEFPSGEGGG